MPNNQLALEARRRLLLSFPELQIQNNGRELVDALVEGALCELTNYKGTAALLLVADVNKQIRDSLGLEYSNNELIPSLERLAHAGNLAFRDEGHQAFVFHPDRYTEIMRNRGDRDRIEADVRASWTRQVLERNPLSSADMDELWSALESFVADVVNTRAEEAAAFLYMTDELGQVRFRSILQSKLPLIEQHVTKRELLPIAEREFLRFFDSASRECVSYLADRLHAAFYFHLLSIDPLASELVKENFSGKILYLDTNFLYRFLSPWADAGICSCDGC
jgi:hypothetical protein